MASGFFTFNNSFGQNFKHPDYYIYTVLVLNFNDILYHQAKENLIPMETPKI